MACLELCQPECGSLMRSSEPPPSFLPPVHPPPCQGLCWVLRKLGVVTLELQVMGASVHFMTQVLLYEETAWRWSSGEARLAAALLIFLHVAMCAGGAAQHHGLTGSISAPSCCTGQRTSHVLRGDDVVGADPGREVWYGVPGESPAGAGVAALVQNPHEAGRADWSVSSSPHSCLLFIFVSSDPCSSCIFL